VRSSQAWAPRGERVVVKKLLTNVHLHSIISCISPISVVNVSMKKLLKASKITKIQRGKKRKVIAVPPKSATIYRSLCEIH
jgi:hypothetical protein